MYNEKCVSLCEQIESKNLEIENYKTIIFGLQKALVEKENEVEKLKLELAKEKEEVNISRRESKRLSVSLTESIFPGNEAQMNELKGKIALLNEEKKDFNLKLLAKDNDIKER